MPVYGSRQTRDSIAEDRFGLVKASHEVVGDDFPEHVTLPDHFLIDGETLNIAGVSIQSREWGAGEAECMTILHFPDQRSLFVADLIQHQMTAFLLEGRSGPWLTQLSKLRSAFPDVAMVYPGHGEPGPLDALVDAQARYLETSANWWKWRATARIYKTEALNGSHRQWRNVIPITSPSPPSRISSSKMQRRWQRNSTAPVDAAPVAECSAQW